MQYKQLGNSSMNVSRIAFGCMSLHSDKDSFQQLVDKAIDKGINLFDTADLYDKGLNESALGNALKGKRNNVFIATKVGNEWRPDGSGWDWNPRKNYILKAVTESLRRLQTDYIDLYQLHGGTIYDPIDETIEAFEELVKQGKIRYYGISSIRPNVIREWISRSNITSIMMQYSLLDRRPEELIPLLQAKNIGLLVRGSVAQGLLVNKPAKSYIDYQPYEVEKARHAIENVSGNKRKNAQSAIQFVLNHQAVTAAVVGMRTDEQLQEAASSTDVMNLSTKEMEILRSALPVNYYKEHR